jgi:hypothetical protein
VQLTPKCYVEHFHVVVWQLQLKCWITVELFEVVGQRCTDLLIFSVFFFLTRTSWCGGENYQGHLFIYEQLMKIYRPTTLAFIHQTPGLNTRSSATAVAIIHISGCDSLPPQSSSHLVIVNLPIWLSIPVRMLVFRVLSFDYPERQLRLFTSRDVTVYTFSPKWEQSFDYQFGIPFEKITFTLLTHHIHQMSSGSWFPGSILSLDSPQRRLRLFAFWDVTVLNFLQTSSNLVIVNLPL